MTVTGSRTHPLGWLPWAVSGVLLCLSVVVVVLIVAPRWESFWASAVADGETRVALRWGGATVDGTPVAATDDEVSVQPGAGWIIRPGVLLTAPDHSMRVGVQLTVRGDAEARWDAAVAEGFAGEQRETLRTGAVLRWVTLDDGWFGVVELPCAGSSDEVAVVTASGVSDAQFALGQLLETICASPAAPPKT